MKLKNYNIVYLNLDSRIDRKKQINKQLKQYKLKATRISAVNGKMLKNKKYRNKISKELEIPEKNLRVSFWMNRSNFKTMINQEDLVLGRVGCQDFLLRLGSGLGKRPCGGCCAMSGYGMLSSLVLDQVR